MTRRLLIGVAAVSILMLPGSALAGGELNVFLGQKSLDSDWDPLDDHSELGVALTFGGDWPLSLAVDVLSSEDDTRFMDFKVTAETLEIDVGVRKLFGEKIQPYVGGGLAIIDGELSVNGGSGSDDAAGFWINVGVLFRIGKRFNLGIDARLSDADIKIEGFEFDAGGTHIGGLIGFRWGGT